MCAFHDSVELICVGYINSLPRATKCRTCSGNVLWHVMKCSLKWLCNEMFHDITTMEYPMIWNILWQEIFYDIKYSMTWNILWHEIFYDMKYSMTWNILWQEIFSNMKYSMTRLCNQMFFHVTVMKCPMTWFSWNKTQYYSKLQFIAVYDRYSS
jgi:hypothetical protein